MKRFCKNELIYHCICFTLDGFSGIFRSSSWMCIAVCNRGYDPEERSSRYSEKKKFWHQGVLQGNLSCVSHSTFSVPGKADADLSSVIMCPLREGSQALKMFCFLTMETNFLFLHNQILDWVLLLFLFVGALNCNISIDSFNTLAHFLR